MCDINKSFATNNVCRICLSSDRKLISLQKYNVFLFYEQLTNIDVRGDQLPQSLCLRCCYLVVKAASFKTTALRSDALLRNLLSSDVYPVPDINLEEYKLSSDLTIKSFDVDHADYHFVHTEPSQTILEDKHEIHLPETEDIDAEPIEDDTYTSCDKTVSKKIKKVIKKKVDKVDKRLKPANEVLNDDIFNITDLSHEQQMFEIQKRQYSSNYKNSEFKCTECYKGFLDEDAFKGHMYRHTDQCGIYQCHICKIRFKKLHALRNHSTCHMQKFTCKKCSYITFRRHAAKLHEEYHKGTTYECPHCLENFDKISTYMSHVRIKHPSDIVCELCGYSFISAKGLGLHKKLKHRFDDHQVPPDGPNCSKCDVQFSHLEALERHVQLSAKHRDERETGRKRERRPREHHNRSTEQKDAGVQKKRSNNKTDEPISCEQCEMQLPDPLSYYRHFRRMHPDKNRTNYPSMKAKSMCEVCGKMFQSLALLQDHSYTHTDDKHFKCNECDKYFQRKYRLIAHRRVHGSARVHSCTVCGKGFTTASNMQRHMVSHTGLKPFKCEMCGKCFKHASEKRVHVTYVHMKKPWPKRARGKRREDNRQIPVPIPMPIQNAAEIVQPLWPTCSDPKMDSRMEEKSIYYNVKI